MIRAEEISDISVVRTVHIAAFPAEDEADLVDRLRANGNLSISLVAIEDAKVVGHIAFSPVSINGVELAGVGLAPVAMLPSHHGRGLGSQLIRAGLESCKHANMDFAVVLGAPGYYRRFGFSTASESGLDNEFGVGDEFMVMELKKGCLADVRGIVRYADEFRVFL